MTYVIAEPCVDLMDTACVEEWPVDCIDEGARTMRIHLDECADCNVCEPVYPVEAICAEGDVPGAWSGYVRANADFFADLGVTSSARGTVKIDRDVPLVAQLPRKGRACLLDAGPS